MSADSLHAVELSCRSRAVNAPHHGARREHDEERCANEAAARGPAGHAYAMLRIRMVKAAAGFDTRS